VYSGRYYLGLRKELRDAADLTLGDTVDITLELDASR
jgi:hypothetical protein